MGTEFGEVEIQEFVDVVVHLQLNSEDCCKCGWRKELCLKWQIMLWDAISVKPLSKTTSALSPL